MGKRPIPPFVVLSRALTSLVHVQTFAYQIPGKAGVTRWNIDYARQLTAAGFIEKRVVIARGEQLAIMRRNEWDREKAARLVPPFPPGIAAPIVYQGALFYILIDGMHRNARSYNLGIPFDADLLTDDAARACWMEGPIELMPWGQP